MRKSLVFLGSLVLGLFGVAQADLNDGLIAYYPFNGNANDESGNNNHFTTRGSPKYVDGAKGQGISFDGVDDTVTRSSLTSGNGFTWSGWFKIQEEGDDLVFLMEQGDLNFNWSPAILYRDGKIEFYVWQTESVTFESNLPRERWTQIAITAESDGTKSLYLNGDLAAKSDAPAGVAFDGPALTLGASNIDSTPRFSKVMVDELRVYDRALSPAEIRSLFEFDSGDSQSQIVINEQFDDADLENFDITRQNISINDGFLKTSGRGTLVRAEILGPKRIKLRVRPDHRWETFSLFIATNGESGGFAELLGLQATWTTDYSALQWMDRATAQGELARLEMGFPAGQWLDIEIIDNLTSASVIINGEARLDVDLSNYERRGNKIGLHSRELGGGSTVDYITVETLTTVPVSPAAPVVQLGALYESPSGESVVIDATPTAGFPAEFTYQWCFNGFKIPANLGGTASTINIDSLQANEGTWSVTITNETGSVEESFEYRIFADTDSDGLSDAFEELISETNLNKEDTDDDGLTDTEEFNTFRTNPNSADSDSDGFTDLYELETAYNPNSAESVPDALVNIITAIEVKFNAAVGATYAIEFSTDNQNWDVIEDDIVGEGGAVERLYSKQDFPTGFFRVERRDQ